LQQDDDDRNDQQDVNETAHRVSGDQSQQPQYEKDYGDGIKHVGVPFVTRAQ
jgi:hypothetical protein